MIESESIIQNDEILREQVLEWMKESETEEWFMLQVIMGKYYGPFEQNLSARKIIEEEKLNYYPYRADF